MSNSFQFATQPLELKSHLRWSTLPVGPLWSTQLIYPPACSPSFSPVKTQASGFSLRGTKSAFQVSNRIKTHQLDFPCVIFLFGLTNYTLDS